MRFSPRGVCILKWRVSIGITYPLPEIEIALDSVHVKVVVKAEKQTAMGVDTVATSAHVTERYTSVSSSFLSISFKVRFEGLRVPLAHP